MPVQDRYAEYQSDQRKFFDELITEDWETYKSKAWDYTRTFEVQQLFKRIQPAHILDIGCGCGFHDIVMARNDFVEHIDAIDYSEQSILKAETNYAHPKVARHVADFTTFTPVHNYDLIVSFQVFEHLHNPEEYIKFCAKYSERGKWVAICTPNRLRLDNRVRSFQGNSLQVTDPMHLKEYTVPEISALGRRYGLVYRYHYGHGLHPFTMFKTTFLAGLDFKKSTRYGYLMSFLASIIVVIMENTGTGDA